MKKISRIVALFLILQILFLTVSPVITVAKADDLIIDYNGEVTLVVMGNSVLAVETTKNNPTSAPSATSAPSQPSKPTQAPPSTAPSPAAKTVQKVTQVAPPSSSTTVKISPNTGTDKKLKITIETSTGTTNNTNQKAPASPSTAVVNTVTTPVATSTPTSISNTVTSTDKAADNVVLRDQDKQPVLTITPDQKQTTGVNIQQHDVNVSTSLPVQIDTQTHIISVQTSAGTEKVSILPDQAVAGAEKQTNTNPTNSKPTVSLVSENGNATYIVDQQKKGKLLGVFDVTVPSQVKISAETGKTVSVWQSPIGTFLGFLIR